MAAESVSLTYGELLDLSLGDAHEYGLVSFCLLKELLLRMTEDLGFSKRTAMVYTTSQPPEEISRALALKTKSVTVPAATHTLESLSITVPAGQTATAQTPTITQTRTQLKRLSFAQAQPQGAAAIGAAVAAALTTPGTSRAANGGVATVSPSTPGATMAEQKVGGKSTMVIPSIFLSKSQPSSNTYDLAPASAHMASSQPDSSAFRPLSATDAWHQLQSEKRLECAEEGISGVATLVERTAARVDAVERRLDDISPWCRAQQYEQTELVTLVQKVTQLQEDHEALKRTLQSVESRARTNIAYSVSASDPKRVPETLTAVGLSETLTPAERDGLARATPTANASRRDRASEAAVPSAGSGAAVHSDAWEISEKVPAALPEGSCAHLADRTASADGGRRPSASSEAGGSVTIIPSGQVRSNLTVTSGDSGAPLQQQEPPASRLLMESLTALREGAQFSGSVEFEDGADVPGQQRHSVYEKLRTQEELLKGLEEALARMCSQVQRDLSGMADKVNTLAALPPPKEVSDHDDRFVSRQDFEERLGAYDETYLTLEQHLKHLADAYGEWQERLKRIEPEIELKATHQEVDHLQNKIADLRTEVDELMSVLEREIEQDAAAAFRRRMLPFNCLSCSKKMALNKDNLPGPSLPSESPLRCTKSPKPYTTYELDSLRRLAKLSTKPAGDDGGSSVGPLYHIPRPCGGAYTMIDPLKTDRKPAFRVGASFDDEVCGPFPVINIINQNIINRGRLGGGGVGGGGAVGSPTIGKTAKLPKIGK